MKDHNPDLANARKKNAIIETSKCRRNTSLISVCVLKLNLSPI